MIKLPKTQDVYKHFKGGRYIVVGEGQHTETLERLVYYKKLPTDHELDVIWARPYDMFYHDQVEVDGQKVARFKKIGYTSSKGEVIITSSGDANDE